MSGVWGVLQPLWGDGEEDGGTPGAGLGMRVPQHPVLGRMERIRAKQEKYHQERVPRSVTEGQDETRPGES